MRFGQIRGKDVGYGYAVMICVMLFPLSLLSIIYDRDLYTPLHLKIYTARRGYYIESLTTEIYLHIA